MRSASDSFPPPNGDITTLVEQACGGEGRAFRELFRLKVGGVHRLVYRLVGASASPDVDDVVQMVFIEAFRSLPAFRGDALFSTWLARIAIRVSMRARRRAKPHCLPLEAAGPLRTDASGPERTASAREALAWVDTLLFDLKPKRRIAFVLHALEGYSMQDIAVMVNASVATVKVRIHDARRDIERTLRKHPWLAEGWGGGNGS